MQPYWVQSKRNHVIWLGMSCHETKKHISSLERRKKTEVLCQECSTCADFMCHFCSQRLFVLVGVIQQTCSRYVYSPLFCFCSCTLQSKTWPTLQNQTINTEVSSWLAAAFFVMTEWKPAFHCVIHNWLHKKEMKKKKKKLLWRLKFNAFSSPACTSVSISRELKHGTAHTGMRPKRSKHASYHTYHSKNILNIKWVGKVSILTACTNFKNQGCTDLGPFFFSTSRSRGPAVISGFPSSCACN